MKTLKEKVIELNPTEKEINLVGNTMKDITENEVPKLYSEFIKDIERQYGTYGKKVLKREIEKAIKKKFKENYKRMI